MLRRTLLFVVIVGLVDAASPVVRADEPQMSLDAVLALPLSVGSVALLATYDADPRISPRLLDALKDTRADVRASAARVLLARGDVGALAALAAAADAETDVIAAAEQNRALLTLGEASHDAASVERATRLGAYATRVVVETFARLRPASLVTHLPQLIDRGPVSEALAGAIERVDDSAYPQVVQAALAKGDAVLVDAVLTQSRRDAAPLDASSVEPVLTHSDAAMRRPALWHILMADVEPASAPGLAAAVARLREASPGHAAPSASSGRAGADPAAADAAFEQFLVDLWGRRQGQPAAGADWRPAIDALKRRRTPHDWTSAARVRLRISDAEFTALTGSKPVAAARRDDRAPEPLRGDAIGTFLTPSPWVPGLLSDLVKITGCKSGKVAHVVTSWLADGRSLRQKRTEFPDACLRTADVLARLAIAPELAPPSARADVIVVPFTKDALACDADRTFVRTRPTYDAISGAAEGIQLEREVKPEYPREMLKAGVAGSVWVHASIAGTGCVRSARVTRLAHRGLAMNALVAVSRWRFEVTPVDGQPTPHAALIDVVFISGQ